MEERRRSDLSFRTIIPRMALVALIAAILLITRACLAPSTKGPLVSGPLPSVFAPFRHAAGAYAAGAVGIGQMAAAGLTLALPTNTNAELADPPSGVRYIDRSLEVILYHDRNDDAAMQAAVRQRLADLSNDPNVVAFYVLDDYPGNVARQLIEIHQLVTEANRTAVVPRATVCAFSAPLGVTASATAQFARAITNYSNQACDLVAFYSYGGPPTTGAEWTMGSTLGRYEGMLSAAPYDWNIQTHPLIGIPQAFGTPFRPAPLPAELTGQIAGFCRGGASAILGFTWDPVPETLQAPEIVTTLGTDPLLRSAFARGIQACRSIWSG